MKRAILIGLLLFAGCKGPKGDKGVSGSNGTIATYTGVIPNSGSVNFPATSDNTAVLAYISLTGTCCWELVASAPINAPSTSQSFQANNQAGFGQFTNVPAGQFYKIVLVNPS